MNAVLEVLTKDEAQELTRCESEIEAGASQFVRVGMALATVRNQKLYRAEFETFEAYCTQKWGLERRRSYQIIDAAKVAQELPPSIRVNEAQASALANIKPEMRAEVFRKLESTGKVTAARIKEVAGISKSESSDSDVKKISHESDLAKRLETIRIEFLDLVYCDRSEHDLNQIDSALRPLFLEVETRAVAANPKHAETLRRLTNHIINPQPIIGHVEPDLHFKH